MSIILFYYKENDQADRAHVRNMLVDQTTDNSGRAVHPRVPTPVILRVFALDAGQEYEVYTKEIDPILTSWGGDSFTKTIGYTQLKPGHYKIQLENLRRSPEFNGIPVSFGIGMNGFKQGAPKEK